jgi:hypothetical protein
MVAEIMTMTMTTAGPLPERIDFHFDKPIDDPSYLWIYWDKLHYAPLDLPKLGEDRVLPVVPYGEAIGG